MTIPDGVMQSELEPAKLNSVAAIGADALGQFTHEQFVQGVRDIGVSRLNAEDQRRLLSVKLVYGAGARPSVRGICFYDAWHNESGNTLLEICAFGEESDVQLAGTTLHELAHALAGAGTGHGRTWRLACKALGLIRCEASGQAYVASDFAPDVWDCISLLPSPSDGVPAGRARLDGHIRRPCGQGIGTRGGTSRGPGSGRQRLWMCECHPWPYRVRVARQDFSARCEKCGALFKQDAAKARPMGTESTTQT
jgi:hypothetical protein